MPNFRRFARPLALARPLSVALVLACAPAIGWSADRDAPEAKIDRVARTSQVISVSPSDEYLVKLREDYGERELKILAEDLTREVDRQLQKAGLTQYQIALIVHDAVPNRPTFQQLSDRVGLSFNLSIGIGRADVEAKILSAEGEFLRSFRYDWEEESLFFTPRGGDTWYDARRAFYFFALALRKDLEKSPPVVVPVSATIPQ